jgi:mannosyl-3-phosphoglycerate phosphatase
MSKPTATLLVVTDLDGTLLDAETYVLDPAREALDALRAARVPLVVATSKTRAEVEPIGVMIGGNSIFIVENGGAILLPKSHESISGAAVRGDDATVILELGTSRDRLIAELADMARESGANVRGFAQLSVDEIARLTGLSEPQARLASKRDYDEPFLVDDPRHIPALEEAARRRGLCVTRGGRLHHLTGDTDKGRALRVLLDEMTRGSRDPFTIGLGDAANDLPFLDIVDRPIVIPRPDGLLDTALAAALPAAERAPYPGPAGWNLAVLAVLSGQTLPPVATDHSVES